MIKLYLVIVMVLWLGGTTKAQTRAHPIEKIDSLMRLEKKPILVLLSTDWCVYCHMQKRQLARNKEFQKRFDKFYFTIFNAERKDSLVFHNRLFGYRSAGASGIHELAIALNGAEKIGFPTWVVLDANYRVLFRHQGILLPKQIADVAGFLDGIKR